MLKQASLTPVANLSTSEQDTGRKWIDGRPIYKKTIALPPPAGTGVQSFAHGITGLDLVLDGFGYVVLADASHIPLPRISTDPTTLALYFYNWDATNLSLYVGTSYTTTSAVASGYYTAEYVKA